MSSDYEALAAGCEVEPGNLTRYAVFADWLEEREKDDTKSHVLLLRYGLRWCAESGRHPSHWPSGLSLSHTATPSPDPEDWLVPASGGWAWLVPAPRPRRNSSVTELLDRAAWADTYERILARRPACALPAGTTVEEANLGVVAFATWADAVGWAGHTFVRAPASAELFVSAFRDAHNIMSGRTPDTRDQK